MRAYGDGGRRVSHRQTGTKGAWTFSHRLEKHRRAVVGQGAGEPLEVGEGDGGERPAHGGQEAVHVGTAGAPGVLGPAMRRAVY